MSVANATHPQTEKPQTGKSMVDIDIEKNDGSTSDVVVSESTASNALYKGRSWLSKLVSWGVEVRGIAPVPVEERTDTRLVNIFTVWFTMSVSVLPIITGMAGTLSYGLGLRDASLIILFFSMLCTIPPAYLSTLGPKTGLRQMIQARFSFGKYGVMVPVLLNLATITGFCVIDCVIGGQTLASVNPDSISSNVGIVIIAIIALFISFCGIKVLHQFERYAWIPSLIAIIIATGCGGKHLSEQAEVEAPLAGTVLSYGGLIAGFLIPWGALSSDFATYIRPDAPSIKIFAYTYLGLFLPTVPLMVLGAAIGGAVPNVPSWAEGNETGSAGGVLAAMLISAGGFGKFIVVLLAFSILGNIAASLYSITLNFQMLLPILVRVPRAVFSVIMTAIIIPVSIKAAESFFASLENFIGIIAYWAAAFIAIVTTEHVVFRKGDCSSYKHSSWNVAQELPSGIAALAAGVMSFGMVVPCMAQIWYVGPIAETTGDIGFEMAMCISAVLYVPFRTLEIRLRGGRL